jgi:hypothetical protein
MTAQIGTCSKCVNLVREQRKMKKTEELYHAASTEDHTSLPYR